MHIDYNNMELCIENFTEAGNNLMWRADWESYQKKICESKTMTRMENKIHYNRIVDGLSNNRSIDVLNEDSLKNVKKMDEEEYIIKYIEENKGSKTPQEIVNGLAVAMSISVSDNARMKSLYDMVLKQLRENPPVLAEVSIAIDGKTVPIIANEDGVRAGENTVSFDFPATQSRDDMTGEIIAISTPQGRPNRLNTGAFGGAGERMTEVPGQFSLPIRLPPPMMPVTFNRLALPDTNVVPAPPTYPTSSKGYNQDILRGLFADDSKEMGTQTDEDNYPGAALEMTKGNVAKYTTAKKVGAGKLTQTAQTGEEGIIATPAMRNKYPGGGYSGKERESTLRGTRPDYENISTVSMASSGASYTPSGTQIMSPLRGMTFGGD